MCCTEKIYFITLFIKYDKQHRAWKTVIGQSSTVSHKSQKWGLPFPIDIRHSLGYEKTEKEEKDKI